ncbi:hypothetical protein QL285_087352 [Trifolium repens]|nr:hypothetical protein QL285_087352 [Trifolium repens]
MIKPTDLKKPVNPLQKIYEKYFWCDGFPTISEHDNDEVIKNFLQMVRDETGAKVDRRMVVAVPDWDVFNNPKERTRSSKKPVVFEEPAEEEDADNENQEQDGNDEHDSVDDMIDNPKNVRAADYGLASVSVCRRVIIHTLLSRMSSYPQGQHLGY